MSMIDDALAANATIANGFDPSRGKPPAPRIAIVTCADPRLTDIEQMLGLAHADVDMIRNFGTVIDDDAVRSLVQVTPVDRARGTRPGLRLRRPHRPPHRGLHRPGNRRRLTGAVAVAGGSGRRSRCPRHRVIRWRGS